MSHIPLSEMQHGRYYEGRCRNATLARWNSTMQRFVHRRTKFGETFLETIPHIDTKEYPYDKFIPQRLVEDPPEAISLEK